MREVVILRRKERLTSDRRTKLIVKITSYIQAAPSYQKRFTAMAARAQLPAFSSTSQMPTFIHSMSQDLCEELKMRHPGNE